MHGGIAAGLRLGDLGFKIRGVTARQVIDNAEYFREILKRNKVIGFKNFVHEADEIRDVLKALYSGDPTNVAGELLGLTHPDHPNVETKENIEEFIKFAWHVDNPFMATPPCLTAMKMVKFDVEHGYGNTVFMSLSNLYQSLPDYIKENLQTAKFLGATGIDDPVRGPAEVVAHPALRTHPDTGETMLYWSGPATALECDGAVPDWFEELKQCVDNYGANKSNRWSWEWEVGDFLVWDNRAVIHGFTPGWERENRIFDRYQIGEEKPFYKPGYLGSLDENFGDTYRFEGVEKDATRGPNPDHIPLVFTKGFYALEDVQDLYQTVTLFVIADQYGELPEDVKKLSREINDPLFNVYMAGPDEDDEVYQNLLRYHRHKLADYPVEGSMFLCTRNGDFHCFWEPGMDLFQYDNPDPSRNVIPQIRAYIQWHPDMRHAGHAWHYPDWFDHQPLQFRPWDYQNLPFMQYINWGQDDPPEDFLVQYAIDTVYGCFNHLKNNDDRRRVVERIHDYIGYMLDLNEHERER